MLRPLVLLMISALPSHAQGLDDRHLMTVPRTGEEQARVAAILAPPTDFLRPEAFESM